MKRSRLPWVEAPPAPRPTLPLTDDRPDTPGTELPANAEQTEPSDLAAEPSTDVPTADAPVEDVPAADAPAEPAAEETAAAEEPAAAAEEPAPAPNRPPPGAGPVIIGTAPEPPPLPTKIQRAAPDKPQRPRRRRVNATQKHRNVFFARLNDFRRSQAAGIEAPEEMDPEAAAAATAAAEAGDAPAPETPVEEAAAPAAEVEAPAADAPAEEAAAPAAEAPAEEAGAPAAEGDAPAADAPAEEAAAPVAEGDAPAAEAPAEQAAAPADKRRTSPPPPIDRPRLIAAIERAGGEEVLREALSPKRDEHGQPLKWATVCADACKGLKPGDPVFGAWVRLAATPVSAIKNEIGMEDRRGGRGGPRRGGPGGDRRPRREDRFGGREGRGDRVSREDLQKLATDGRVGANIRIIGLDDDDKKAREKRRKEEREAKRQAERDRLSRLGY